MTPSSRSLDAEDVSDRLTHLKAALPTRLSDGGSAARKRAAGIDRALEELTVNASDEVDGLAVVAVGGYGRSELSPHSDIDLLFVTGRRAHISADALKKLLYPLWDAGFQVGHAAASAAQAIERVQSDLDAATSLLTARLVAGDPGLFEELIDRRSRWVRKEAKALVRRILEATSKRHENAERAGWVLAPDIKDDAGGLRDLHAVGWLTAIIEAPPPLPDVLQDAGEVLLAVREALHAEVKRKTDRVDIHLQPRVAQRLELTGDDATDDLMQRVHSAARCIEHKGAHAMAHMSEQVLGGPRRSGLTRVLDHGVRVDDGRLDLESDKSSVASALRLLATKAATNRDLDRRALDRLEQIFDRPPIVNWDRPTLDAFYALLQGPHTLGALELLDNVGGWAVLMPELARIRGLAQHDPYHRYTVDAHSFLTVAKVTETIAADSLAQAVAHESQPLHTLYVAALLHDSGKGSGEDHSVAGERIARSVCERMGLSAPDTEEVATLVRRHLLLADTATRRDLDDAKVIQATAETLGEARRLKLLYVLTVADGRATGPQSWSDWRAALIRDLYLRVLIALENGEVPSQDDAATRARNIETFEPALAGRTEAVLSTLPPSYMKSVGVPEMADEIRLLLKAPQPGQVNYRIDQASDAGQAMITLCVVDRPGTLARVAGVFALNRISVLRAQAYSTSEGLALQRFIAEASERTRWDTFGNDLEAACSGRLALEAHVERKARDYTSPADMKLDIRVLQDVAEHSTVVEVRAPDALGLLYAVTRGIGDLDLDIHVAKIDTRGTRVVDVFYVRTLWGTRLDDTHAAELERSITHRVRRLFG